MQPVSAQSRKISTHDGAQLIDRPALLIYRHSLTAAAPWDSSTQSDTMVDTCTHTLYSFVRRDDAFSEFLKIVQSPFQQNFSTNTFLASLGISVGSSALIILLWCFVRPYHSVVYAPKVRVADEKHALPPIGKHLFSWIKPLMKCHEPDLVDRIGLDAVIFLRFMRFARLLFFVLGVLGCFVVIPVNVTCNLKAAVPPTGIWKEQWYALMSPYWMSGSCMWAHIIVAWVFDFIILYFLWVNYRAVLKLRWDYFESPEYVNSLNSRSLMVGLCIRPLSCTKKIAHTD